MRFKKYEDSNCFTLNIIIKNVLMCIITKLYFNVLGLLIV